MANYILWDGKKSTDYGLVIEKYPTLYMPKQKCEEEDIPGRNGTVFFYQDAWENYSQKYEVYAKRSDNYTLQEVWRKLSQWLYVDNTATPELEDYIYMTRNGYHLLQDSYDDGIIRLATFAESIEIENTVNKVGRTDITFNFRPEKFLSTAFEAISFSCSVTNFSSTSGLDNSETNTVAKPLVVIPNNSDGNDITLTISNTDYGESATLTITGDTSVGTFYIDSETQNVFDESLSNLNSLVSIDSEFPKLWPGTNTLYYDGGSFSGTLDIYPRWWSL